MYKRNIKQPLYKFPNIPTPREPARLILTNQQSLTDIINTLPRYGIISYDPSTCYWYIKLPSEWQNATNKILNRLHTYHSHTWYKESVQLAQCWSDLVNIANNISPNADTSTCTVNSVAPPSVVGLHISLGVWSVSDCNIPQSLVESKRVEFRIGDIISFGSIRKTPQNISGQYTNKKNLRYYPTRWLFVEITFVDFQFTTRYPPHISIACVAVQLNVAKVDKFEIEYKRYKDKQYDIKNADTQSVSEIKVINNANTTSSSTITSITPQTPNYQTECKMSVFICLCLFTILTCAYVCLYIV